MASVQDMRRQYEGNCHCGLIRYTFKLDEPLAPEGSGKINRCNCSICTKNGYLLIYPKRVDVGFAENSNEKLQSYYFGNKKKGHCFCPQCGSSVLIDFKDSDNLAQRPHLGLNARLLKDFDLDNAEFTTFDGRNRLNPPYSG